MGSNFNLRNKKKENIEMDDGCIKKLISYFYIIYIIVYMGVSMV